MSWDAKDVALLKELWAAGHSAGQIASRLGHSRNAVSAKLKRMGHKRGHKPPTANPRIVAVPTRRPALAAACARPVDGWCRSAQRGSRSRSRPGNSPSASFTPCWPMRSGIRADACRARSRRIGMIDPLLTGAEAGMLAEIKPRGEGAGRRARTGYMVLPFDSLAVLAVLPVRFWQRGLAAVLASVALA